VPATTLSESPRIVLAVGLPGSGKSTWFRQISANPISSDAIRRQLVDDESHQTANARVFEIVRVMLRQRLELRRPVSYVDATNLTRRERRPYIDIARQFDCAIEALWFDVPLAVCKARNAVRYRVVPESAMNLMAARFVPPSREEGFDRITIAAIAPDPGEKSQVESVD
jgi:predicted kinase